MDVNDLLISMAAGARRVQALAEGASDEQARWRPDPGCWSILEVVVHLLDEEREDFRARLDVTLHHPGDPWPAIDPEGWVTERAYNERDLVESLRAFLAARDESLAWLRGLQAPDWDAVTQASFGPIRAGDVLAAWVAHDLLHTRQLVELHWAHTLAQVAPYRVEYAGAW